MLTPSYTKKVHIEANTKIYKKKTYSLTKNCAYKDPNVQLCLPLISHTTEGLIQKRLQNLQSCKLGTLKVKYS